MLGQLYHQQQLVLACLCCSLVLVVGVVRSGCWLEVLGTSRIGLVHLSAEHIVNMSGGCSVLALVAGRLVWGGSWYG